MKKNCIWLVLTLVVVASMILTSCAATVTTPTPSKTTTAPPTTAPTTTTTKIVPKGDATVLFAQLGTQMTDPHWHVGSPEFPMLHAMNTMLCWIDPDTAKVGPWMATSWELASDQVTWTFHLAKGPKFHSGNPVTAHDYEYSFIKFVVEERCAPANLQSIKDRYEKVWAADDYTLMVKTKEPYSTLLVNNVRGGPFKVPMPVDSKYIKEVGDEEFKKKPSLTGPFKFVEQVLGDYTKMTAFDDAYPNPPYVRNLTYKIVPEATTRLAMLKTGQADMMADVLGPTIPEAKNTPGLRTVSAKEVDIIEIILSDYLYPDQPSPLLDKRVRQAMAYAIDRQAIVNKLYYGEGSPQIAPSVVSWHLGYDPSVKGYPYDPAKAKQLLKDAGYENGFKLTFWSRSQHMDASMATAGYWKDIGIDVDLKPIEAGVYLREATQKTLRGVWPTTVPTMPPDYAIHLMEYWLKGNPWSWCANPEYNNKVADMLSTMDEAKRVEKMKALCVQITDDLPSRIPLICRNGVYALGEKVASVTTGRDSYWCYPETLKLK